MAMEKLQLAMIPNNLRTFWMELGLYFKIGLEKKRGRFKEVQTCYGEEWKACKNVWSGLASEDEIESKLGRSDTLKLVGNASLFVCEQIFRKGYSFLLISLNSEMRKRMGIYILDEILGILPEDILRGVGNERILVFGYSISKYPLFPILIDLYLRLFEFYFYSLSIQYRFHRRQQIAHLLHAREILTWHI